MQYPIATYPCEEGGYVAEIPALKGCLAQGETLDEALNELKVVTELWLEMAQKYGQQLPDVADSIEQMKILSR
jgi:antitoxin HicB